MKPRQSRSEPSCTKAAWRSRHARAQAAAGLLDGVGNLSSTRAFVYRGTRDACYTHTVMAQTREFFARFAANATAQLRFVDDVPSRAIHRRSLTRSSMKRSFRSDRPHVRRGAGEWAVRIGEMRHRGTMATLTLDPPHTPAIGLNHVESDTSLS